MNASFVQLELTTHCNFTCFYCAGRDMPQKHMSLGIFNDILSRLPKGDLTVSLQGEGEPMLHPSFWEMVAAVKSAGYRPYTITNGSAMSDPEKIAAEFPAIGISVDTLDPVFAEKIGRLQLDRVLRNVERLREHMDGSRIFVHTVSMGQPLDELRRWIGKLGLRHMVQPLQRKEDYRSRYAKHVPPAQHGRRSACKFLREGSTKYFNVDGLELPCAFIKDTSKYQGIESMTAAFTAGQVPTTCTGCPALT